jgi:exodeoxyribonuclease VII large subunit
MPAWSGVWCRFPETVPTGEVKRACRPKLKNSLIVYIIYIIRRFIKEIVRASCLCYARPMGPYSQPERHIYTVSELTAAIKSLLESSYPFVWVTGEISNFRVPASGHFYFTLKDSDAQVSAVMFRRQNRTLKFVPEDGMAVTALGRLNVYEPRGIYQMILEYVEPMGVGELQLAYEQLKNRLEAEGLFKEENKRALPFLPLTISVVTSPTGAVLRDIMTVVYRRYPNMAVEIAPVRVQGEAAAGEIVQAIEMLNKRGDSDVIVVARGGGSLEDLQAFNSEVVARAIFGSRIPIVSAVGHETDFTIADFVADVRAPTPSAAAELVVPVKDELAGVVQGLIESLGLGMLQRVRLGRERTVHISKRLVHPGRRLADYRLRLDEGLGRMVGGLSRLLARRGDQLSVIQHKVFRCSPRQSLNKLNKQLEYYNQKFCSKMTILCYKKRSDLRAAIAKLNALNPLAILERGYSVTRSLPDCELVRDVKDVGVGDEVEVTLWKGALECRVERKKENGQTNI